MAEKRTDQESVYFKLRVLSIAIARKIIIPKIKSAVDAAAEIMQ
ncbi:MAG TPA: hypothetical protein VJ028_03735 [Patescibacteria group bacterium]|nr:hypothetical protein [Patescibacteria group bacterium]